jgi:ethanolamine utilization protein EutN
VIGCVVATRVYEGLEGRKLLLVDPIDAEDEVDGEPFVACDVVGAGPGSRVIWLGGREASLALDPPGGPVDATCVAILERHGGVKGEDF